LLPKSLRKTGKDLMHFETVLFQPICDHSYVFSLNLMLLTKRKRILAQLSISVAKVDKAVTLLGVEGSAGKLPVEAGWHSVLA
jgi:hypothetical protein